MGLMDDFEHQFQKTIKSADFDELIVPGFDCSILEEAADELEAASDEITELLDDGEIIDTIVGGEDN